MGGNVNSVWAEHKELKQHIIKMEDQVRKTHLQAKDIYQPILDHTKNIVIPVLRATQMMGLSELRQYHMERAEKNLDVEVEKDMYLPDYMSTLNEESKKKSVREKEATARLGEGHSYFSQSPQELLEAKERVVNETEEEFRSHHITRISGDEFAPDPESGNMITSVEQLWRVKRTTENEIKVFQNTRQTSRDRAALMEAECKIDMFTDVLQHLDDAIHLLYQANGVDEKTGKRVGSIKKKQAQKQFALAMEAYRDSVKNSRENEKKRIISRVENSAAFKEHLNIVEHASLVEAQHLEESKMSTDEQNLSDDEELYFPSKIAVANRYRDAVVELRDMIRENQTNYAQNKEVVDKLYQEFWQMLKERTRLANRRSAFAHAFRVIYGADYKSVVTDAVTYVTRDTGEDHALDVWSLQIVTAMKYFLKKKEPTETRYRLFLYGHCVVSLADIDQMYERAQRVVHLQEEGKTDEQIADMMYAEEQTERSLQAEENVRTELEQRKARIRQEGGNPDEDAEVQQKEKLLLVLSKHAFQVDEGHPEHIIDREVLFSDQSEVEHYILKQEMFHKIFTDPQDNAAKRRIVGEDGKEKWITRFKISGITRDIISNISSIENPGDCGMEKAYHYLDNIVIISRQEKSVVAEEEYAKAQAEIDQLIQSGEIKSEEREARLEERKKERYEERLVQALEEEIVMERQEKERIETYIQEKNLRGLPEWPTMEELAHWRKLTHPLFEKIQGLSYRMDNLFMGTLFEQLPVQMQKEILELHAFYGGVEELATCVLNLYTNRAQGLPGEPLKSIEQYIDEKRESDQRALRNKAARASAAQGAS